MSNREGRAGRRGVPAHTLAAFLDHYTYTGHNPSLTNDWRVPVPLDRLRRINGVHLDDSWVRSIRRWRNGQVKFVSTKGLAEALLRFGFDLPEFHRWAKAHDLPIT